jgi:hypothetical protein
MHYEFIRKSLIDYGGFSESEISRMAKELVEICVRHGKPTYVEVSEEIAICYEVSEGKGTIVVGSSKADKKQADDKLMLKSDEISKLLDSMVHFQKSKEEVLCFHNEVNRYGFLSVGEIIIDLKRMDVELLESNIKIFKNGGKKFYRLTYTPQQSGKSCGLSRVEFAFGHLIDGFTYIAEKGTYRDNKLFFKLKN